MKKLSQQYPYKKLSKYEGLLGRIKCRAPTTYVGIEVELEKVNTSYFASSAIKSTQDGSLKLDGVEFVSVPIKVCYLEQELERLKKSLISYDVSSRCSVHIHLNVRDFTQEELYRFMLLYLIFEKSLFNFSGNRWKNNFCTPLRSYPKKVLETLYKLKKEGLQTCTWYKYFSFNISPIWGGESEKAIGTVEFRHMEGTLDIERIINWINLIVSLKISAKKFSTKELEDNILVMNTTSSYYWLAREVFKGWSSLILSQPSFKEDVEGGITYCKSVMPNEDQYKVHPIIEIRNYMFPEKLSISEYYQEDIPF